MLNQNNTGLILVDIQGKLARQVHDSNKLISNIQTLIQGCKILKIPIIWLEQNPAGLGRTVSELCEFLTDFKPIEKHTFNGCDNPNFITAVNESGVKQWLMCGIEAHVCLYQTALGLLSLNYQVEIIADCISSRAEGNIKLALNKLQNNGAALTSLEMCLFELVKDSRKDEFKQLLPLLK